MAEQRVFAEICCGKVRAMRESMRRGHDADQLIVEEWNALRT